MLYHLKSAGVGQHDLVTTRQCNKTCSRIWSVETSELTEVWGAVAEWVSASTGDRTIDGSTPTAGDFERVAIPLTLLCQCLSDETLKAVGPFYLVSMPGEVKYPTSPHWNVSLVDSTSHSKSPVCEYAALDAALHSIRRRRRSETLVAIYIVEKRADY